MENYAHLYYSLPWWFIQCLETHSNYCDFIVLLKKFFYLKTSFFIKNDCKIFYSEATIINIHCVKWVHIWSYFGPHFYRIFPHSDWIRRDTPYFLRIQSEYGKKNARKMREKCEKKNARKMLTRIIPNTETFYAVLCLYFCFYIFIFMCWLHQKRGCYLKTLENWICVYCNRLQLFLIV